MTAAVASAAIAHAQFPDVLSERECPGCSVLFAAAVPFEGTWSTALTAVDDAGWALADLACVTACTATNRAAAAALLAASRKPAAELLPQLSALNARGVSFGCEALGLVDQAVSPLPLTIRREGRTLVLRYEERGAVRTIALGGGVAPHSAARFDGDTLVIETRGEGVDATERYSVSADGRWLELSLDVRSAGKQHAARPVTLTKRWLRTPGTRVFATSGCDVESAGLEASLADFVDPRRIDARR